MRSDLKVIGLQASIPRRLTTSGTAIEAGEPVHSTSTADNSGGATGGSTNSYLLVANDTPIIGTYKFGGVAIENSLNVAAGTTEAQNLSCACPMPNVGILRGDAETKGNISTQAELNAIIQDYVLISYSATGATDGGELYTIHDDASADTSGLEIVRGNIALGTLDVLVDFRAYRHDVTVT